MKHKLIKKIFVEYNMLNAAIEKIYKLLRNNCKDKEAKILDECEKIREYRRKNYEAKGG